MRYKFIYTSHVSGPAHSLVHFILSKAPFFGPFQIHFHMHGVYTQQCTREENITVNDPEMVFSFWPKRETLGEVRVCLVKIYDWQIFLNINFKCQYVL